MMLTILSCTYYTFVYLLWWDNCYKILPTIFKLDRLPFYYELKSFSYSGSKSFSYQCLSYIFFRAIFPSSLWAIDFSSLPIFILSCWCITLETYFKKYIREISLCYVSWKLFPRSNFAPNTRIHSNIGYQEYRVICSIFSTFTILHVFWWMKVLTKGN